MLRSTAPRLLLLLCLAMPLTGCAGGLDLAVIGAASSGLRMGMEVSQTGRRKLALMTDAPPVVEAARTACADLGLTLHAVEQRAERTWVLRVSDRKRAMRIIVEERAPRLTQLQVNVGLFGPQSVAELILKRIVADLDLPPDPQDARRRPRNPPGYNRPPCWTSR